MLALSGNVRIFLCIDPTDFRKGIEGLSAVTQDLFPEKLLTGAYFVFLNKTKNKIKILFWDLDGFVIWYKKLEMGCFQCNLQKGLIDRRELFLLLEGITPKKMRKKTF